MAVPENVRTDVDLFSDEVLNDPYPTLKVLRDMGPVTYFNKYNVWYVSRYDLVLNWVRDWKTFSSDPGVGLNDEVNEAWQEALICEDPPVHTEKRKFFNDLIGPAAMAKHKDAIDARAAMLADNLIAKGSVDAVKDIGQDLPINVVMDLIGWPEYVRSRLIDLAAGSFNALGPAGNKRTEDSMKAIADITRVAEEVFDADAFIPDGWGHQLSAIAKDGTWTREAVCGLLQGFIVAAFDTTIYGISNGVLMFAENPDQWDLLRENPELSRQAFTEILRLETPLQHLSRVATRDVDAGEGIVIPKGDRVVFSYAAGNRDERAFDNPDRFDLLRKNKVSFGFGTGIHTCAGQALARLEANAVFEAMAKRIKRFELTGKPVRNMSNIARGYLSIPIKIIAD